MVLYSAQENIKIKNQLISRMEKMDEQYTETMTRLLNNMKKLTNSIADGFAILKNTLFCPPPSTYPPSGACNPGLYLHLVHHLYFILSLLQEIKHHLMQTTIFMILPCNDSTSIILWSSDFIRLILPYSDVNVQVP